MLATVASSTSANRIKRQLYEYGVHSTVSQTPHSLTKEGCGYSLHFDESAKKIVEKAASDLGIKVRAFYNENISGNKTTYSKL